MKTYIGTKIIQAEPALRVGGEIISPHDILPEDVSVEEGYRVKYPDGYESWSPKDVFEEAYREIDGMNFGLAIEAAKKGAKSHAGAGTAREGGWSIALDTPTESPATRTQRRL